MNWNEIEGRWSTVCGKVKETWGELTDDDLKQISGKKDQLVGKLQEKYGIAKEEASKKADAFADSISL